MTEKKTQNEHPVSVSIARQPVFDEKGQLWGYELFCVGSDETTRSGFPEHENVALNVASSAYIGLQQILGRGKKIIVNFNEKSMLDDLPYAFPPILAAVKVAEDIYTKPHVPDALKRLKSDGYLIAVGGFTGNPDFGPLYSLADIIGTDVSAGQKDALGALLDIARPNTALLLAGQVEDPARFKMCKELGFTLFHGPFFKSPGKITVRKLSSIEMSRFNLLRLIEADEPDLDQLAATIQGDVSISFRLLAYLNSTAFGLPQKIKSIHQAILLLGWQKMKHWLRLVLLTDMSQSKDVPELVLLSAQRGKFLELIARDHDFWGFDPDSLNLLGIFSLLDALLGIPMTEIVGYLPLENRLKAALCREPNNEYLPLLHLAQYFEEAKWAEVEKMIHQLNLDGNKIRAAFQTSIDWAGALATLHSKKTQGD
ncbi:MAG: HDOD domain-containing protein [Proteobacteria bacterium]|nr:HDOD domain-containing protein [Pseudomonadota bacterium]